MTDGRSLVGVVGAVLPTVGGVCCVGISAGVATVGGVAGAALAWLMPVLPGVALMGAGALLLRARSGQPWRRWHGLVAVASASCLVSALVVVPVLAARFGLGVSTVARCCPDRQGRVRVSLGAAGAGDGVTVRYG